MEPGKLTTEEREWLERAARRMPGDHFDFGYTDESEYGRIYFATSVDADRMPHGIWAIRAGENDAANARILDFKPDTSLDTVRQVLATDAVGCIESMIEKGLLRHG
jgi:hypothetical protein